MGVVDPRFYGKVLSRFFRGCVNFKLRVYNKKVYLAFLFYPTNLERKSC